MSKKELEKEKAALLKWLTELEDETVIRYLSEFRQKKRSFSELRSIIDKKMKGGDSEKRKTAPAPKKGKPSDKAIEFQKSLLSWPEMTDEELNFIQEKRKHLNEWK